MSDDVTILSSNARCRPSLKALLVVPVRLLVVQLLLVLPLHLLVHLLLPVLLLLLLLLLLVLVLLLLLVLLVLAIGLQWQQLCGRPVGSSKAASLNVAQRHVCCCWPWLAANIFSFSARLVR